MLTSTFTLEKIGDKFVFVSEEHSIPVSSMKTGKGTLYELVRGNFISHKEALDLWLSLSEIEIPVAFTSAYKDDCRETSDILYLEYGALLEIQKFEDVMNGEIPFLPEHTKDVTISQTKNGIRFTGKGFISPEIRYRTHAFSFLEDYEQRGYITSAEKIILECQVTNFLGYANPGYWPNTVLN